MSADVSMTDTLPSTQPQIKTPKSQTLFTTTLKSAPFAYAHLELLTDPPQSTTTTTQPQLDNLQVRSYCTAALRQFLGEHGVAISLDILKISNGRECWLRLPRQDLGAFSAAITAYPGMTQGGVTSLFRLVRCGDWLGGLVGGDGEKGIWSS